MLRGYSLATPTCIILCSVAPCGAITARLEMVARSDRVLALPNLYITTPNAKYLYYTPNLHYTYCIINKSCILTLVNKVRKCTQFILKIALINDSV